MSKYLRTTLPTNPKNSICFDIDGKQTWMDCTPEVKSYAQQNLKTGDAVEITKETRDGKDFATRVSKPGAPAPAASTPAAQAAVASGAGTASAPATQKTQEPVRSSYGTKSPEDSKQIRRLSVLSSASTALTAVANTCTIDINNLPETLIALYNRLLAEVEKP